MQQNTLYSGLLITDKQDRINEKIMLEFLKKKGSCMNSNIITKVQIQTQNINKLRFITLYSMPSRRNSKTWPAKSQTARALFHTLLGVVLTANCFLLASKCESPRLAGHGAEGTSRSVQSCFSRVNSRALLVVHEALRCSVEPTCNHSSWLDPDTPSNK